ncbi:MAG: hypothetical protein Q9227_008800 [Pyrenula ochraceoflavens]
MKCFLVENSIYPEEDRIHVSDTPFPALHRAIIDQQIEVVRELTDNPTYSSTELDLLKRQPIHVAASSPSLEILLYVVNKCNHEDLNARDIFKRVPLDYAAECGNFENFRWLNTRGARLDNRDIFCHSILARAAASGQFEIVQYMLDEQVDPNDSRIAMGALHKAAEYGRTDVVSLLLYYGAQDRKLKDGTTAQAIALQKNFPEIAAMIQANTMIPSTSAYGTTGEINAQDAYTGTQSSSISFVPRQHGNNNSLRMGEQDFELPEIRRPNFMAGWTPGQQIGKSLDYHRPLVNNRLEYQHQPLDSVNSGNPTSYHHSQSLLNSSVSCPTPRYSQRMPPRTASAYRPGLPGCPENTDSRVTQDVSGRYQNFLGAYRSPRRYAPSDEAIQ